MNVASFWTGLTGAVLNLSAAVWLLVGFRPDDPRYTEPGKFAVEKHEKGFRLRLPDPGNLPELPRRQSRPVGLVVLGSTLQLLNIVLELGAK